jgi:hypothetical protein
VLDANLRMGATESSNRSVMQPQRSQGLVELAYIREIAADHPGLAAPARVIAIRARGGAEVAIQ